MRANFQISLPTIPGKSIKFKIQDIKSAAFGIQKPRFPDNKANLTKKFIESFQNFKQVKRDEETETQADTQMNKSHVGERKQINFRSIVPENKKFLLPLYSSMKAEELTKINYSMSTDAKEGRGFSFAKAGISDENQEEVDEDQISAKARQHLTDNYYFTSDDKALKVEQQSKRLKPSAVFKNETRKRVQDRIYASQVPGPGSYIKDNQIKKAQQVQRPSKSERPKIMDYKHLKNVITKVLIEQQNVQIDEQPEKEIKQDHMFIIDDRDRFGEQLFPIAPKLKVPGPGAYQVGDTLEQKAKKLLLVQEQRKLLKQWFNN